MKSVQVPVIKLQGQVSTNSSGVEKLMQLYYEASKYRDTEICLDFYDMQWVDANLSALLNALEHRLAQENNITLTADLDFLSEKFHVLFRNGWIRHRDYQIYDVQDSTIPCTSFLPSQEQQFLDYVEKKLMCHRGMPALEKGLRKRIQSDLIEIFTNIYRHARTNEPFFVCGQFYPKQKYFILTMVDLGVGFLPPIQDYTSGQVTKDIDAIKWALSGKSSLITDPTKEIGGFGLQGIHQYCLLNKGTFHIYTGTDFWGTDLENTIGKGHRTLRSRFKGSLINLFFNLAA